MIFSKSSGFTIQEADLIFLSDPNLPNRYICPDCNSVRFGEDILLRLNSVPASDFVYSIKVLCRHCRT